MSLRRSWLTQAMFGSTEAIPAMRYWKHLGIVPQFYRYPSDYPRRRGYVRLIDMARTLGDLNEAWGNAIYEHLREELKL